MLVLTIPEFPVVRERDWSITSLQLTQETTDYPHRSENREVWYWFHIVLYVICFGVYQSIMQIHVPYLDMPVIITD
jgi:hypothetical protein